MIGTARIDQIDAWQRVLVSDLLSAQMFLYRQRVIRSTLDGRIVAHDHAFAPVDPSDARDDSSCRDVIVVHAVGGELRQLKKWTAGIDESAHAFSRQQLPPRRVARPCSVAAAFLDRRNLVAQIRDERRHCRAVLGEHRITRRQLGREEHGRPIFRGLRDARRAARTIRRPRR